MTAQSHLGEYAAMLVQSKTDAGIIESPTTLAKYYLVLRNHFTDWQDVRICNITRAAVRTWHTKLGLLVKAGKYSPNTVNYWWAFFKMVMREACIEFDLKDPTRGFPNITNGGYRVYTLEEPNSLTIEELPGFFDMARKHERTHYAMLALGVLTGRRPCELRPLRWRGKDPDLNWETGALVIRRSQTLGEPMESTKQKREVGAWLSPQMMEILRRHVVEIRGFRKSSDLLFPGFRSEYLSPVALQKPIRHICRLAGIKKRITPTGAMRRTYQDLCRQASVSDTVQRAMSGHATIEMKEWYSTLGEVEGRTALVRMASIAGID